MSTPPGQTPGTSSSSHSLEATPPVGPQSSGTQQSQPQSQPSPSESGSSTNVGSSASLTGKTPTHTRTNSSQTSAGFRRTNKYNIFSNWEFTPAEHPAPVTQETKDEVLSRYNENSEIYHHEQYGDNLSDDDWDILDVHGKERVRNADGSWSKKERWLIKTHEKSGSETSGSGTASTSQGSAHTTTEKRPYLAHTAMFENVPPQLRSQEDRMERGEILKDEDYIAELPFSQRFSIRKQKVKTWCKQNVTWNWLWAFLVLLVFLFIVMILPIANKMNWFEKTPPPSTEVVEVISPYKYPTLSAIRTSLVDPDTPQSALTRKAMSGEDWELTFSDEFNAEGRTFYPGMDQFWQAVDIHYAATKDLEWYDPDAAVTKKGTLNLRLDNFENHDLFYRSGMLQSWNKMCFSEGIMEVSARMPGSAYTAGTWPGIWALGNLARPGYLASTDGVWPYSYDECDAGITANQSSPDGISYLPGQRLNKCTCKGEDHPNRGVGRGAPEIDLLEGAHSTDFATDVHFGIASQTLQIAPFDIWYQPDYEFVSVHNKSISNINSYLGTPFQEMLSVQTTVNEAWYETVVDMEHPTHKTNDTTYFQKYSVEYLSKNKDPMENYCRFFLGDEPTATIMGPATHPNGNVGWRNLPREPMAIVLNLGVSPSWSAIQWLNFFFPMTFEIDYVRIYQPKGHKNGLTCDPSDFPTSDYIDSHLNAYMNSNLTSWEDAGYSMPLNKLTSDKC